ncbi:uncharacterized protein CTRU02_200942 [Colletotrichum truncatum]|uniref:Uncharacterized protein n=1 Tax=Colletotrichum truncatum TaxID=5467 RepID=A0ACC3ZG19_COLTU|nr:uncharacterized protein CTRU02_00709 [Colletotrichum truncatum]KAF6801960.1 hypothetical protein CTRU02_00709 [Colletotrichum truncatum]
MEPRENPTESQNSLLCNSCQEWSQWTGIEEYGSPLQYSVSYNHLVENTFECLICNFIISRINAWENSKQQNLEKAKLDVGILGPFYFDTKVPEPEPLYERLDTSDSSSDTVSRVWVQLSVTQRENSPGSHEQQDTRRDVPLCTITPSLLLHYSKVEGGKGQLWGVADGEVRFIDLDLMRGWIRDCENSHGEKCVGKYNHKDDMPQGFRVIDTHNMKVMEPDSAVSFVALSYMWSASSDGSKEIQLEKNNLSLLEEPGSLASCSIPDIVLDAIYLCRDLGESYLWVDRLCIIQDDAVTKPAQIGAMDKIYRSATFTIVAALNDRYGKGLPGCSKRPRLPLSSVLRTPRQPEVEGRGVKPNGMTAEVDRSLWNKRGWTFQERVLSKRRLFITEHQAIFECSVTTAEEELTWNAGFVRPTESTVNSETDHNQLELTKTQGEYLAPGNVERKGFSGDVGFYIAEMPSLKDYRDWIESYSSRQLSFGTDIINAFMGVGNVLRDALGTRLLFGLPEKFLTQSLMWSCVGSLARRGEVPHIPSWSWASSLKPVDYQRISGRKPYSQNQLQHIASLVEFYYQDPDKGFRKLEVEQRWMEHETSIAEIACRTELPLTLVQQKARPADWRSDLIWKQSPHNPWEARGHLQLDSQAQSIAALFPGSLVFNTTVASLSIKHFDLPERSPKRGQEAEEDSGGDDVGVEICAENGERVGILNRVSREWIEPREDANGNKRLFDFIVICGALESYSIRKWLAFMRQWDKTWQLCVMMVERLPCEPFVARRVEVGMIQTSMWKDCNPRWETVVLC